MAGSTGGVKLLNLREIGVMDLNATGCQQSPCQLNSSGVGRIRHLRKVFLAFCLDFIELFGTERRDFRNGISRFACCFNNAIFNAHCLLSPIDHL